MAAFTILRVGVTWDKVTGVPSWLPPFVVWRLGYEAKNESRNEAADVVGAYADERSLVRWGFCDSYPPFPSSAVSWRNRRGADIPNYLGRESAQGATRVSAGVPPTLRMRIWRIFAVSITKMLCFCGAIA